MNRLSKEDLAQMNQEYFQSMNKQKLVEVTANLHSLAVEQVEKLEKNSSNSSLPPSSDGFRGKSKILPSGVIQSVTCPYKKCQAA
ncbi:MAG: hypothetical protein AAF208_10730 [Cyanobacteria bacterium P01_A01_bin.45]